MTVRDPAIRLRHVDPVDGNRIERDVGICSCTTEYLSPLADHEKRDEHQEIKIDSHSRSVRGWHVIDFLGGSADNFVVAQAILQRNSRMASRAVISRSEQGKMLGSAEIKISAIIGMGWKIDCR